MNYFILFLFNFSPLVSQAEIPANRWEIISSALTYHVNYVLKSVEGTSHELKGKGKCETEICEFLFAVPVKSFDSGDSNRDTHMLEVTKAAMFPMVIARTKISKKSDLNSLRIDMDIEFGGQKHTYKSIPTTVKSEERNFRMTGKIPLLLSDFQMERPSLLGIKIDDLVPVTFEVLWKSE